MDKQLTYKCPNCGGAIAFDPGAQKMKCPYCDTEFEMDALRDMDAALNEDGKDAMHWDTSSGTQWQAGETDGMRIYACQSGDGGIHLKTVAYNIECFQNCIVLVLRQDAIFVV